MTRQYGGLSGHPTLTKHGIAERAFFLIDMQGIVRQHNGLCKGEKM